VSGFWCCFFNLFSVECTVQYLFYTSLLLLPYDCLTADTNKKAVLSAKPQMLSNVEVPVVMSYTHLLKYFKHLSFDRVISKTGLSTYPLTCSLLAETGITHSASADQD
jgi:hypothetical protein